MVGMPGFWPDFDQIFVPTFGQIFGQVFDQGFGDPEIQCTVLLGQKIQCTVLLVQKIQEKSKKIL